MKIMIIKSIVFVLTCAIIFILILLINSIISKRDGSSGKKIEMNINIGQPQGSNIKNILAKDDHLYIVVSDGKLSDRIVILNTNNGETISTINLN